MAPLRESDPDFCIDDFVAHQVAEILRAARLHAQAQADEARAKPIEGQPADARTKTANKNPFGPERRARRRIGSG